MKNELNCFKIVKRLVKKIILIIFLSGLLIFGYYIMAFEPNNIKIEKQIVAIENLPQSFDKIRIVQLSDFHSLWFGPREKRVLEMLEELKPDFVFITGDFVDPITKAITDRNFNSVRIFWQELGQKYENRIFGILGNHDNKIVKNLLEKNGITVLNDQSRKLFKGEEFIYLLGIDDRGTGQADLSKAMEGVEGERPKILLTHGPEIIDKIVRAKIDLALVGHTHGGQVNIPIIGRLIQPLSKYGEKYTAGLFKIEKTYLYVNRGIGTSFFPVRFDCPPEITLIELKL